MIEIFIGAGFAIIAVLLAILMANRWWSPVWGPLEIGVSGVKIASREISILTWNLGFAAQGAKAEFFADGGDNIRSLKRAEVVTAASAIADTIRETSADISLLQENSARSFMTRGVKVERVIRQTVKPAVAPYWKDFGTRFVPFGLSMSHGMSMLTNLNVAQVSSLKLPQENRFYGGVLRKHYGGLVSRFPISGSDKAWVIINLHLAAYDDGAEVRIEQIRVLLACALECFARGDHVVIGGDWNLKLLDDDGVFSPREPAQGWLHLFPVEMLPDGWQIAADPMVPTVRSMAQPYVEGESFVSGIDGFVVSPNVEALECAAQDLKFKHSDHNPVFGRFSARD